MINDGYSYSAASTTLSLKISEMQNLFEKQLRIDAEIKAITDEMETLPGVPKYIDDWFDSLSDVNKPIDKTFKLKDFEKMFKLGRTYKKLIEERENNTRHMKIAVMDNIIQQIKNVENK